MGPDVQYYELPATPSDGFYNEEPLDLTTTKRYISEDEAPLDLRINSAAKQLRNHILSLLFPDQLFRMEISDDKHSDFLMTPMSFPQIPNIDSEYQVLCQIGEGTFSSVYLAKKKPFSYEDTMCYAIKLLVPTSHPRRVAVELWCLKHIGGEDNVASLEDSFRNGTHIAIVTPFVPACRFSEYFISMDVTETRTYLYNLLIALRRVHSFNVIHRDVKPANFLYNRINKKYLLIDFGLAQFVGGDMSLSKRKTNVDTDIARTPLTSCVSRLNRTENTPGSAKRKRSSETCVTPCNASMTQPHKKYKLENNAYSYNTPKVLPSTSQMQAPKKVKQPNSCSCLGKPIVCSECIRKPSIHAARAGTSGFRPPEVLLKCKEQTTAVDIWAVGVMLLSVLSGRYPFFRAADDTTALIEVVTLFGSQKIQSVAKQLGKILHSSTVVPALDIEKICKTLRKADHNLHIDAVIETAKDLQICPGCKQSIDYTGCVCRLASPTGSDGLSSILAKGNSAARRLVFCAKDVKANGKSFVSLSDHVNNFGETESPEEDPFPSSAYNLLLRLLDPNPHSRITAAEALSHPFITGEDC